MSKRKIQHLDDPKGRQSFHDNRVFNHGLKWDKKANTKPILSEIVKRIEDFPLDLTCIIAHDAITGRRTRDKIPTKAIVKLKLPYSTSVSKEIDVRYLEGLLSYKDITHFAVSIEPERTVIHYTTCKCRAQENLLNGCGHIFLILNPSDHDNTLVGKSPFPFLCRGYCHTGGPETAFIALMEQYGLVEGTRAVCHLPLRGENHQDNPEKELMNTGRRVVSIPKESASKMKGKLKKKLFKTCKNPTYFYELSKARAEAEKRAEQLAEARMEYLMKKRVREEYLEMYQECLPITSFKSVGFFTDEEYIASMMYFCTAVEEAALESEYEIDVEELIESVSLPKCMERYSAFRTRFRDVELKKLDAVKDLGLDYKLCIDLVNDNGFN